MKSSYNRRDIVDALLQLGLKEGDCVFVHANLGFFGRLEGASTPEAYGSAFLDSFRAVIGSSGTVCVPVFTYSFCKGQPFDPAVTCSSMGMFSEYVRQHGEAVRSCDPNFSIAAMGRLAKGLTDNAPAYSFGADSFWERFLRTNGVICNLNFDAGSTFVHFVERCNAVPYRFDKGFRNLLRTDDGWREETFYHFVRHLDRPAEDTSMPKVDALLRKRGLVRTARLGRGYVLAISSREYFDCLTERILKDPYILTVGGKDE